LFESDEFFSGSGTPSAFGGAPTHSRGINDIISESTVGAGPSVQLVERMSATVRRLESERAASKDELARITAQRDESRQQVVELMREVEEKRSSDTRVQELEQKLQEIDARYETTLELLGEKSEQVEELQADIADLKKIYRELVDSTMK
jgi:chromosome segregation ATPase